MPGATVCSHGLLCCRRVVSGDGLGCRAMTDVAITNRRADSSANADLTELARHGADSFGYKANLRVDRELAELLRLRVAQINNCTYCLDLHYKAARTLASPHR